MRLANERTEGQTERSFIYNLIRPSFGRPFFMHWDNSVQFGAASRVDYDWMFGPSFGARWNYQWRRFNFETSGKYSVVLGSVRESGNFRDIDDIRLVRGPLNGPFRTVDKFYLEGNFPLNRSLHTSVGITEMKVKLSYPLTNHVALGVGYSLSLFQNVVLAPSWNVPGAWTARPELAGSVTAAISP